MTTSPPAPARRGGPIAQLLHPIRARLALAAVLAFTGSALTLAPLAGIAHIAAIVLDGSASTAAPARIGIWPAALASVACMFAGLVLVAAGELAAHLADNRLTSRLRLDIARRLAQVPLGWFGARASGEVKQAMQDDIATLHGLTAHFTTSVARALGAIGGAALYLFALDWRLAGVTLLPFAGFMLFLRRAMRAGGAGMDDFLLWLGRLNSASVEFADGIAVLKTFGGGARAHHAYRAAVDGFAAAFTAFTRPLVAAMAHAHALIAPVTVLGLVLAGGALFAALGWMAPLDVLPFALVAPGICAPMLLLHTLLHDLGSATAAARRVQALLATPILAQPAPGQGRQPAGHRISFEAVSHAYDGQRALHQVSLTLEPGTVTAIVGASGAGKSTLARLLLRFFDPDQGRITLGGVDLRDLESAQLYRSIGFVLQEVRLIHASVHDNIALGRPGASRAQVEQAARAANIHHRILELPRGYDSVVGADTRLSGGEQQRVSIARAILLDAPVLVLDEATAAADAGNEAAIQEALARFARGRTVLVVAHRLHTVAQADRIVVLEAGAIVEQGRHHELLALGGRYARLWSLDRHAAVAAEDAPC